jgi:hypothetical protein
VNTPERIRDPLVAEPEPPMPGRPRPVTPLALETQPYAVLPAKGESVTTPFAPDVPQFPVQAQPVVLMAALLDA